MLFYGIHKRCLFEQNNKAETGVETVKWTIEMDVCTVEHEKQQTKRWEGEGYVSHKCQSCI